MLALSCILLALAALPSEGGVWGQGPGHGHLHGGICHSNHQQLTEDQVIVRVVNELDINNDDDVSLGELVLFFAELLGKSVGGNVDLDSDPDLLLQTIEDFHITEHEFVQAWHNRYHDSEAFIRASFATVFDRNGDGLMDGDEIRSMRNYNLKYFDANSDGVLQKAEMVTFLENIYKSGVCG